MLKSTFFKEERWDPAPPHPPTKPLNKQTKNLKNQSLQTTSHNISMVFLKGK